MNEYGPNNPAPGTRLWRLRNYPETLLAEARDDLAQALPAIVGAWDNDEIDNVGAAELILRVVVASLRERVPA